jgi:threonine aldolase
VVDLRSDFLSRPTAVMVEAMVEAASQPASFELRENPAQRQLESVAAEILGQEDALLCPTCTMANEIGLGLLAGPGDLVVTQGDAHVVTSEAGAPAALFGITVAALSEGAAPPLASWERAAMRKSDALRSSVRAFALENTHNRAGGLPVGLDYLSGVAEIARRNGVASIWTGRV